MSDFTRRQFLKSLSVAGVATTVAGLGACGNDKGRRETTDSIDNTASTSDQILLDNYKEALVYKIALAFDAEPDDVQMVQLDIYPEEDNEEQVYGFVINNELHYVQGGSHCLDFYHDDMINAASDAGITATSAIPITPAINFEIETYFMDLDQTKPEGFAKKSLSDCGKSLCENFWKKEGSMLQAYEKPMGKTVLISLNNKSALDSFKMTALLEDEDYKDQRNAIANFRNLLLLKIANTTNVGIGDVTLVDILQDDLAFGQGFQVNNVLYVSEPMRTNGGEDYVDDRAKGRIEKYATDNGLITKWVGYEVTHPVAEYLNSLQLSNPNYLVALFDGERCLESYNWRYCSNGNIIASPIKPYVYEIEQ